MKKLITIDEFLKDINGASNLYVDVNSLCNISGATPIQITYKVDGIISLMRHPKRLVFTSGGSKVIINDIQRIAKCCVYGILKRHIEYRVLCGKYRPFRATLCVRRE